MKRKLAAVGSLTVLMASLSGGAMADNASVPDGQGTQPQGTQAQGADQQAHFERIKQKVTQRLQHKIKWTQERLDCVQNAQDSMALRACLHPHKRDKKDQQQ